MTLPFKALNSVLPILVFLMSLMVLFATSAQADNVSPFIGSYSGSAEFDDGGELEHRDMSAEIAETDDGFSVSWTSVTYKPDGRTKEKSYTIEFVPSEREGIFASAMQTNVFGKQIPLNPLKGEPFVWSRIEDGTMSVFSLFIDEAGNYEMQEYHRTLAEGGLQLEFRRFQNGLAVRSIETFLDRN